MTEPCAPINEGIYKKKKPLIFRDFLVDLEGVEPKPICIYISTSYTSFCVKAVFF